MLALSVTARLAAVVRTLRVPKRARLLVTEAILALCIAVLPVRRTRGAASGRLQGLCHSPLRLCVVALPRARRAVPCRGLAL